jgi:hypothetical protein
MTGKPDMLINTLACGRHFDILCIHKLCQIGEYAYIYVNYHIKPTIVPTYEKNSHSFIVTWNENHLFSSLSYNIYLQFIKISL